MVTIGKEIPYSAKWFRKNYGGRSNFCSPLTFSSLFRAPYPIAKMLQYGNDFGLTQELDNISASSALDEKLNATQRVIFETNAKFTIPEAILLDVLTDEVEDEQSVYCYLFVILTGTGFHKIAILRTIEGYHLLDVNLDNMRFSTDIKELINLQRICNLSVLVNAYTGEYLQYPKKVFSHLL